jgi:hypothetical protein
LELGWEMESDSAKVLITEAGNRECPSKCTCEIGRGNQFAYSFLWKYVNDHLDVFKWTGKNDYVALCEPEFISFGGGLVSLV